MSQGPEQSQPDSPAFVPSPDPDHPESPPAEAPKTSAPASPVAPKPARGTTTSLFSNAILMVIGAALAAGGYALARAYAPPPPPGEVAGASVADAVKPDEFKALSSRVDEMKSSLDQVSKQVASRPDFAPELKMQRDNFDNLTRTVTEMSTRFDSINQKLETIGKMEVGSSSGRVDNLEKKVTDLTHSIDSLKGGRESSGSMMAARAGDSSLEDPAMKQAIELYNAKKYGEALDAFTKLRANNPNDARTWYYCALANGFATRQWLGETEKLVNMGMDKEKLGQPETAKIDESFVALTPATGKDWLADYRKRVNTR